MQINQEGGVPTSSMELLDERVRKVMLDEGYTSLTLVQELAIPKVISGRHVLIVAPTGSGKTEAALFPILSEMLKKNYFERVSALYVTPLRALNRDIMRRIEKISIKLGIEVLVRHGDTPTSRRRLISQKPPHILVTTPETLSYILVNPRLREALRNVKWVVIDEVHELLESKRGSQILANLERLVEIAGNFQRIGLSASIGDIETARNFLAYGRRVEVVNVAGVRDMDIHLISGYYSIDFSEKIKAIADLVRKHGTTIVFTNTRSEAELIGVKLRELGLDVKVHHGSLSREEREDTERLLKEGRLSCVVATSSLELGIDVGSVDAVIQVSSPRQTLKLVQRVGRARHGPGRRAVGYVVCDDNLDDIVESAVVIRRALNADFERARPYDKPYDVLIHTLVGMGLEGNYTAERALETLSRSYTFSSLTRDELDEIISKAVELKYIKIQSSGVIEATKKGRIFYMTTTTIVDSPFYDVVDSLTRRVVGSLDEDFVVELSEGSNIALSGKLWSVVSVDLVRNKVYVEEVPEGDALVPFWIGETIPVDYKVAREVCSTLSETASKLKLPSRYTSYMNDVAIEYVESLLVKHKSSGGRFPSDRRVVVEYVSDKIPLLIIHSCLGTKGNRGLAYLVLYDIENTYSMQLAYKADPYRVIVALPYSPPPQLIVNMVLNTLKTDKLVDAVLENMENSTLFDILLLNIGRRLKIIPKDVNLGEIRAILKGLRRDNVIAAEAVKEGLTKYVDLEVLAKLIEGIKSGKVHVDIVINSKPSPIAVEGLKTVKTYDRVKFSAIPVSTIAKIVERRILESRVLLICLHCGNSWESIIKDLGNRVICSRCGYGLVGVSKVISDDIIKVARKAIKLKKDYRFKLSGEEVEIFERLMDAAVLVLEYGRKAVEALVAHGVGPKTARRALQYDGEKFYLKLYELEKEYERTRQFWD